MHSEQLLHVHLCILSLVSIFVARVLHVPHNYIGAACRLGHLGLELEDRIGTDRAANACILFLFSNFFCGNSLACPQNHLQFGSGLQAWTSGAGAGREDRHGQRSQCLNPLPCQHFVSRVLHVHRTTRNLVVVCRLGHLGL